MKLVGLILLFAVGALAQKAEQKYEIEKAKAQLAQIQARDAQASAVLATLRQQYTENFPDVVAAKNALQQIQSSEAILQDRLKALTQQLSATQRPTEFEIFQQEQLQGFAKRGEEVAEKLEALRRTYKDNYPDVVALQTELDSIRQRELSLQQQTLQPSTPDRWWRRSSTVQNLGLTADQQKKMDDVFQQFRAKLIDSNAALQKAEAALDPLVSASPLDDAKISAQIDRVAEARAELEKTNGRMLLGLRKQLTPAQWSKLNASIPSGSGSVLEQALK